MTVELTGEQVIHYRQVLADHTTDRRSGACPLCGVARCVPVPERYPALAGG